MMRTIGLDVGRHWATVAIKEPGAPVRAADRIAVSPDGLRRFAATLGPDDQVVLEASTNTWAIAGLLAAHAGRVVVSNPLRTRAIADAKTKTDQIDAAVLAELLAADYIPEVWQPDERTRELRALVAQRTALVRSRTAQRNRVAAVLARALLAPPVADTFSVAGRAWLATLVLPAHESLAMATALRLHDAIETEVAAVDQAIAVAVADDRGVRHLLTVPGLGATTCTCLVAVIGDVTRFPRPNKLVSYLGLDPRVRQSGARSFTGHISRAGQAHARSLLIEAAHAAVRTPGPLRAFHDRVRRRRGSGVAIVAVARKLAVLAWHLLTKDTDYRWGPATLTADKVRRLELLAGAPRRYELRGTFRDARAERARARSLERAALETAEQAYRELVGSRTRPIARPATDAAAAAGSD